MDKLIALVVAFAAYLVQWITKKTVVVGALVVGALALMTAFVAAMHSLAGTISGSVPSWVVGLGYLIPDNMAACFGAIVSARIARWIYDYHYGVLRMAATVN